MLIAVDFDGVISAYEGWRGKGDFALPVPGVRAALKTLKDEGHIILINTTRLEIHQIKEYLEFHDIPFDHLNHSPLNDEKMLHPAKQQADVYIDDRGLRFVGQWDEDFLSAIRNFKPWWKK